MDERFYSPKALAHKLGVSERLVRNLLADGRIASYRIEGTRRIAPADVDEYLSARRDGRDR